MNYTSQFRTNYFHVRDETLFRKFASDCNVEILTKDGMFGLMNPDDGIPDCYDGEPFEGADEEDFDFIELLGNHLAEGQVAVVMQTGQEGMRYLCGEAWAVAWDGRARNVSLERIYEHVLVDMGITGATAAEY